MCEGIEYIRQFPSPGNFEHSEEKWKNNFRDSFVVINCFSKDIYYPDHWTPFSVKCAFNGSERYCFNNRTYSVSEDSLLLLNEGNVYSSFIQSDTEVESLSLNYTKKNITTLEAAYASFTDALPDDPSHTATAHFGFCDKLYEYPRQFATYIDLFREQLRQPVVDKNILNELMYLSLGELVKLHRQTDIDIDRVDAKKRSTRAELYKRLCVAKDYMYSCYRENITLDQLGSVCLLNPAYLLREFKKLFACTPHQYITSIRMQRARMLLIHSRYTIAEIVTETGFLDSSSFTKLFKRTFSLPPHAYRMTFGAEKSQSISGPK